MPQRHMVRLLNTLWAFPVDEVASELAHMPKPLICVGYAPSRGMVTLGYWVLDGEKRDALSFLTARDSGVVMRLMRAQRATRSLQTAVAVVGLDGIESLTWDEFSAFLHDYRFTLAEWKFKRTSRKLARSGFGLAAELRLQHGGVAWGNLTIIPRDDDAAPPTPA